MTNTNTPEQSAIPEEFENWAKEYATKLADDGPRAFREHMWATIHCALTDAYRHLMGPHPGAFKFPHPFPKDPQGETAETQQYRLQCAWYWKQVQECHEELKALQSQPIPSLRWVRAKYQLPPENKLVHCKTSAGRSIVTSAAKGEWDSYPLDEENEWVEFWLEEESLLPVQPKQKKKEITSVEAIWMAIMHFQDVSKEDMSLLSFAEVESELYDVLAKIDPSAKTGQPSIEPDAPINDGWISVDAQLPEAHKRVLVVDRWRGELSVNSMWPGRYQNEEWFKEQFSHWKAAPQLPANVTK